VKYTPDGKFLWAKRIGDHSSTWDRGSDITLDRAGNAYVTGEFGGTVDFGPGPGVTTRSSHGSADIFVLKLDASGKFQWVTTAGGSAADYGSGVAVDGS